MSERDIKRLWEEAGVAEFGLPTHAELEAVKKEIDKQAQKYGFEWDEIAHRYCKELNGYTSEMTLQAVIMYPDMIKVMAHDLDRRAIP